MQVQARMQMLKERLFLHVNAVLEANEDSPSSSLVRTGRWKAAWDKAVRFLARQQGPSTNSQAADLQATLAELHQDIQDQISAEVHILAALACFLELCKCRSRSIAQEAIVA